MFKDEKEFKNFVDKLNIDTKSNAAHREKLKKQMLSVFDESSQKQNAGRQQPDLWRIIMKSPFIKIAAAAVIIIGILLLFLYATNNQNSQNNDNENIVQKNTNDNQIENPDTNRQDDELLLAKQLFEAKNIAGLSELLSSDFETVQMQIAEYLGQVGDETVLPELQILANKFNGFAQDNVYANAITAIEERLSESEPEPEEPTQVTQDDTEPNKPRIPIFKINTGVSGIVIDRDTLQPIQGAFIGFIDFEDRGRTTDANGCFTFIDPIFLLFAEGDSEEIPFLITAPTYATHEMRVRMKKGEMSDVTIKLHPGSKVNGKVLDSDKKPVPDAKVTLIGRSGEYFPVMTDAEGYFEIDGIDPDYSSPYIYVNHPQYLSASINFQPAAAGQSIYQEITLKSGLTVFGQVTDPNGKPVKGVTVGNTFSSHTRDGKKYVTDEEGSYVLDNVDIGELILWAVHKDYPPFVLNTTIDSSQPQKQIDIKLSKPNTLTGKVLDSQGNPVPGVYVSVFDYNGVVNIDIKQHFCNKDGVFTIPNAPVNGELILNVSGQGISSIQHEVNFELDEQIISVNRSGKIYGEVLNAATGEPVQKFTVKMTFTKTGIKGGGYRSTWSELGHIFDSPEGYFDTGVENLAVNSQYRLTIIAEGYDQLTDDLVPVQEISDNPERTQFLLKPSKLRIGKIITVDGQPISGATLVFYPNEDISTKEILPATKTNKEGIYSMLGPGSKYQIIEVNAPGFTPNIFLQEDIIQSDERFKDIILDHGESLSGYVYDDKGNGIANVTISASIDPVRVNNIRTPLANVRYEATTDKNGFYRIQGVPSGKLLISTYSEKSFQWQMKKVNVLPGQIIELNFGDEEGFIISGTFRAGQQELDNTRVILLSSEGEILRTVRTDSHGRFKFYFIEEDSYKFRATWNLRFTDNPENWPENTNFGIERNLKLEQNMELDIDMQADTVTDIQTGQIIKNE